MKDVTELIGKDVYVKPGKYYERLVNLDRELGGGIHIHKVSNDSITIEDLIMQVSQGKILSGFYVHILSDKFRYIFQRFDAAACTLYDDLMGT